MNLTTVERDSIYKFAVENFSNEMIERMERVYTTSRRIYFKEIKLDGISPNDLQDVSELHYICSHLYLAFNPIYDLSFSRKENFKKTVDFLYSLFNNSKKIIESCILIMKNVSFQFEINHPSGNFDGFVSKNFSPAEKFVRNLIADTDKLDDLGEEGFYRKFDSLVKEYPKESSNDIKKRIENIFIDKYSKYHKFMRLKSAKFIFPEEEKKFKNALERFKLTS